MRKGHAVSLVRDATAAAEFRGNRFAVRAICGDTCSRDVRVVTFLLFLSVFVLPGLQSLEYLV
jgi:hypothetical protein